MLSSLLLIALGIGLFGLCLLALSLRQPLGLAPLMLVMGALEGLKAYVLTGTLVEIPLIGAVRVGSVVSYMNALTVVQVLYLRCGLGAARQLAWTLVCVAAALAGVNVLVAALLGQPGVQSPLAAQQLLASGWIELVGNSLLLGGLLASVLIVNALQPLGRWLGLLITLLLVASADTLLFSLLAFGPDALTRSNLLPALAGKAVMALVFATLAYAYLRAAQTRREMGSSGALVGRDLWAALSFRAPLAEMEQQLQTDPISGALNDRYLDQTLPELLHLDQLRGVPTSLAHLRLVNLADIRQTLGERAAELALRHAADTLRAALRHNDVVLRRGPADFLVVLPGTPPQDALQIAEQMRDSLINKPLELADGQKRPLMARVGLAAAPADGDALRTLLLAAARRLALSSPTEPVVGWLTRS
ncbi:diguanylate cyclase (GGDEF)-like protein [Inhella inkyongensis]|uniref:diguanylate cyclase n=1 Tax=Inhella inkyongensis TaxID=392593 RepID=A0A840S158_9BURK|nr:diguanylate cyclase [Inhella inkyongensis]MBB5203138.1 diguanylate cyclase (GGDEF)-like protein [Inhella inkyongensis]